jgi:hypothetical protein
LHYFQFRDCEIRGGLDQAGTVLSDAALLGAAVNTTDLPAEAKLADLDVYQQGVSGIFGLNLQIVLNDGTMLTGLLDPATLNGAQFNMVLPQRGWGPFDNYGWGSYGGDSNARGIFQSVLRVAAANWPKSASPFLAQLKSAASLDSAGNILLSLKLTLDAYVNNPNNAAYRTGRLVGCLGAQKANEPMYSPGERWLKATTPPDVIAGQNAKLKPPKDAPPWYVPAFYDGPFMVDATRNVLVIDLSNSISMTKIGGGPVDLKTFSATVGGSDAVGTIPFSQFLYENAAGICELPLTSEQVQALQTRPLVVTTSLTDIGEQKVLAEDLTGINIVADDRVARLPGDPGSTSSVNAYVTKWGVPVQNLTLQAIVVSVTVGPDGLPPGATVPPGNPGNTPGVEDCVTATIAATDQYGRASLTMTVVKNPGSRTPQLDGQLYFIYPQMAKTPLVTQENRVNLVAWSQYTVLAKPQWDDVRLMMVPYVKLFPGMTARLDLTDPTAFRIYAANPPFGVPDPNDPTKLVPSGAYDVPADYVIMQRIKGGTIPFRLTRDINHPQYMPVSRDLSPAKIQTILNFIQNNYFPPT